MRSAPLPAPRARPAPGRAGPSRTLLAARPATADKVRALRFPRDGHWSAAGHRWAADALLPLLKAGGLP
jgi:hypothetical protein